MEIEAPTGRDAPDAKATHVASNWKHDSPLMRCRFNHQGDLAFSTAEDRSIQRWDLTDGKKTVFTAHDGWVWGITPLADGDTLVTGGTDGCLIWWPARDEQPKPSRIVQAHEGWVRYIDGSPDGKLLASAGNDRKVRVWSASDGKLVRELAGHEADVYSVFFHPTQSCLLSGDLLGKVKQWELPSGKEVRELEAKALHTYNGGQAVHYGGVRSMALSPDGKHLACSGLHKASNPLGAVNEPIVLVFEWETGKLLRSCVSDVKGVAWRAVYDPSGLLIAASGGSGGGFLLFWKDGEEKAFHKLKLPNTARDLDIHPDGVRLATTHHDRHLRVSRMAPDPEATKKKDGKG